MIAGVVPATVHNASHWERDFRILLRALRGELCSALAEEYRLTPAYVSRAISTLATKVASTLTKEEKTHYPSKPKLTDLKKRPQFWVMKIESYMARFKESD
jgi:hypothetical protein